MYFYFEFRLLIQIKLSLLFSAYTSTLGSVLKVKKEKVVCSLFQLLLAALLSPSATFG
jgi:hypothetical protein